MVPSKDNVQIIVTDGDNYAIKDVKVSVDPFSFPIIERGDVCLKKGQVEITDEFGTVDFYIPDQSNISDDILCSNQDKSLVNSEPATAPILIKATHPNHPSQEAEIVFNARYSGGDIFGERWHLASGDTPFSFFTQLSLNPVGPKTLTGETLSFLASATNEGQEKESFSLENNPEGASINSDTGLFAWTPTEDQRGKEYVFDVVVTAGQDTDKEKIVAIIKELGSEDGIETRKLVSLWTAEENSFDSKGSNHGTPENNPTFTEGVSGMAFDFTGNKDNIIIGNPASLNPTEEITLEAWVSVLGNTNSHRQIIGKDDGGAQRSYLLTASDFNKFRGHVEVENYGLAWCDSITKIQMGDWYHVAQTFDGNTLKVYVNGIEECSAPGVGKIKTTSEPVRIGNNNPNTSNFDFIGKIDEVGIHNYALSPSEIKKSYENHGTRVHDVIEMASETTAGSAFLIKELQNVTPYKLQTGDYLEYDLYWKHSNSQIAFDFKTDLNDKKMSQFKNSHSQDQNGKSSHPNTNLPDSNVLNKWYHRVIPIPDILIDTTIQQYKIQSGSDDIGIHTGYLDNIAITDGQGSVRKMIFNHGLPPFKQLSASGLVASIKITSEPDWILYC